MQELTLAENIAHAPQSCGVYQWFENAGDKVPLYVGKAKNLRTRLRQYLVSEDLKTTFLMKRARHISWIATENETEALWTNFLDCVRSRNRMTFAPADLADLSVSRTASVPGAELGQ